MSGFHWQTDRTLVNDVRFCSCFVVSTSLFAIDRDTHLDEIIFHDFLSLRDVPCTVYYNVPHFFALYSFDVIMHLCSVTIMSATHMLKNIFFPSFFNKILSLAVVRTATRAGRFAA